jgi:hypothetical protein
VQLAGETLWTQEIDTQNQLQWQDFEIDLARAAGKSGALGVRADLTAGGEMSTFWKRLELSP